MILLYSSSNGLDYIHLKEQEETKTLEIPSNSGSLSGGWINATI